MKLGVRHECSRDQAAIAQVIISAYEDVAYSNHREQCMVERLRDSAAFVPALSLVAEVDRQIVGHLLLTRISIHTGKSCLAALALAPLSVRPSFQGRGVGSRLVAEGHRRAKELGFRCVVVLGPGAYYARFGYEETSKYGLKLPFAVRTENCRVFDLDEAGLAGVTGRVEYHPSWWNDPGASTGEQPNTR